MRAAGGGNPSKPGCLRTRRCIRRAAWSSEAKSRGGACLAESQTQVVAEQCWPAQAAGGSRISCAEPSNRRAGMSAANMTFTRFIGLLTAWVKERSIKRFGPYEQRPWGDGKSEGARQPTGSLRLHVVAQQNILVAKVKPGSGDDGVRPAFFPLRSGGLKRAFSR